MLDLPHIDRIVSKAAGATLPKASFIRSFSEPTNDAEGQDAVLVTIVIADLKKKPVDGDAALDTIVRVHRELELAGEDRRAIIEFANEGDLTPSGRA